MPLLEPLLPSALFLAGAGILALGLQSLRRPVAGAPGTPAPPGAAEGARIALLDREVAVFTISTCALPLIFCAALILPVAFGRTAFDPAAAAAAGAIAAALYAYCLARLLRAIRRRREARLRREGKIAVGRALEALAAEGYRTFHDVPADGERIDHVVLGSSGVFAVLTRTHPRRGGASPRIEDATVSYNGRVLFFPRRTDAATIPAAERLAERLSEWMRGGLGREIAARAVVAVPGWHVQRTTPEGIAVVNPRQIPSLFKYVVPRPLEAEALRQVADFLEAACRRRPEP
jgi:hypothetical protein